MLYRKYGLPALTVTLTALSASPLAVAAENNANVSGTLIGTYQTADESEVDGQDVDDEFNGELYLFGTLDMGPGAWNLELRGSTSPQDDGVTTTYGAANASVGETLNSNGDGRIAATQLFYELEAGPGQLRAGLLDPTALLDGNAVANNEYSQFLGGPFVNNPSIEFPSFVLGGAYYGDLTNNLGYTVFVGSSSGLEDGNDPSYSNVFSVDDDGKGVFSAAEFGWENEGLTAKAGLWLNSSDHVRLDKPSDDDENNYGIYALFGAPVGSGRVETRAGIANEEVQADANFLSVAYAQPIGDTTLGVGLARRGDSDELQGDTDPIYQAEAYWRVHVGGNFYVTPDLQYIDNSNFDPDRDGVFIAGLRAGLTF